MSPYIFIRGTTPSEVFTVRDQDGPDTYWWKLDVSAVPHGRKTALLPARTAPFAGVNIEQLNVGCGWVAVYPSDPAQLARVEWPTRAWLGDGFSFFPEPQPVIQGELPSFMAVFAAMEGEDRGPDAAALAAYALRHGLSAAQAHEAAEAAR